MATGVIAFLLSTVILLAQAMGAPVGQVEIAGSHWQALTQEPPAEHHEWVERRHLALHLSADGVRVRGKWTLSRRGNAEQALFVVALGPADLRVRKATWNGLPASQWVAERQLMVAGPLSTTAVLEVDAFIPGRPEAGLDLELLRATMGTVEVEAPFDVELSTPEGTPVVPAAGVFVTGARHLRVAKRTPRLTEERAVVVARTAVGLTVGDDAVTGHARVMWLARRGTLVRVALQVAGLGTDLDVMGPNVARWTRDGDHLEVELKSATEMAVVQLAWTTPIAGSTESTLEIPLLAPQNVLRAESTLELARGGEIDAVPLVPGWDPIAPVQLPDWAQGLVRGQPTAAFRRATGGASTRRAHLSLYRFEPVPGPAVVVDIADLLVASNAEGTSLLLARYELTNERAPAIELTPPPGAQLLGAWVTGKKAVVAHREGRLRVKLPRSIETVEGMLSLPVTVAFLVDSPAWRRRERRAFTLPRVHAPVNVTRVTLRLPRDYRSHLDPRQEPVVTTFTRGNEVAYGLSDPDRIAAADLIYCDAIDAWNGNDFGRARQRLEELAQIGASSANQEGLEENMLLVSGSLARAPAASAKKPKDREDRLSERDQKARRIRAQAKARASDTRARQRAHKERAKAFQAAGEYGAAAAEYQQALDETQQLRNLDADESVQYDFETESLAADLEAVEQEASVREQLEQAQLWDGGPFAAVHKSRPLPRLHAIAPIVVPETGETVRYQFVLLEPGAARSVPIRARRHSPRRRRKESAR